MAETEAEAKRKEALQEESMCCPLEVRLVLSPPEELPIFDHDTIQTLQKEGGQVRQERDEALKQVAELKRKLAEQEERAQTAQQQV